MVTSGDSCRGEPSELICGRGLHVEKEAATEAVCQSGQALRAWLLKADQNMARGEAIQSIRKWVDGISFMRC
jgi:hypothetical protein